MKKYFVLLSVLWLLAGCSMLEVYSGKSDMVGKPLPEKEAALTPYYKKSAVVNDSKFWVVVMGFEHGRYVLRPFTSEIFSFNRKGTIHCVAHAWHQSYTDEKGNQRFRDFAGETSFSIYLGNEEKSYYGEKVGDIVTFTNSSFSFNPRYPYPRRYIHGPHWYQNFCIGEQFMPYP